MRKDNRQLRDQYRFGIGEWYGLSFIHLSPTERRSFASLSRSQQKQQPCIPRLAENPSQTCTKEGGVCTLRLYQLSGQSVSVAPGAEGALRTTCPYRFRQGLTVLRWVGETIIGHANPVIVKEVGFLEKQRELAESSEKGDDVGRIDMVLVHPSMEKFVWCALEMQAVYFSGDSMKKEFDFLLRYDGLEIPFPAGKRRPDYRSSGPKRLMPQLQIKVPTLRRWGKKMAVVVDRNFFDAIGEMDHVEDLSNCDIAWFVVRYKEGEGLQANLLPDFVRYTTLERSVEGLTGGIPVSLSEFERRIRQKLQ
jgi:hypothetical protein